MTQFHNESEIQLKIESKSFQKKNYFGDVQNVHLHEIFVCLFHVLT